MEFLTDFVLEARLVKDNYCCHDLVQTYKSPC